MTRVGFVGAGLIANYHAWQLHHCGESEIVSVFDPDTSRAEAFCGWGPAAPAGSVEEVVGAADAVFVCTWTSEHAAAVGAAAAAGRHVFCEKPLGRSLTEARELCEIVDAAGVVNMVGLVLRTSPAMLALRQLAAEVASGRVMTVVFRDDQYLPTQGMYASTWRADREKAGSGVLLEHSIHDLDMLEWLFGPLVEIAAHAGSFHGHEGIEDDVVLLARYAGGHLATLASVWHDMLSRPSQRRMEVFCERALITVEGDTDGPVRWQRDDGSGELAGDALVSWLDERGVDTTCAEARFLRAIRDGQAASPSFAEALRAHELADAAYRSAASGEAVSV